jgi:hypothetical protein
MDVHGEVFDYKWLSLATEGKRAHAIGMLLWDRLLMFALFHDPSCRCAECDSATRGADG